jgi:hypothetical protein
MIYLHEVCKSNIQWLVYPCLTVHQPASFNSETDFEKNDTAAPH